MPLPSSGAISLNDIATEFGGTAPHSISEYYDVATGVPASGTIAFSDFHGTANFSMGGERGVFFGGDETNIIDYISIASTGNATDFGDTFAYGHDRAGTSNGTRGVFLGCSADNTPGGLPTGFSAYGSSVIEYITIGTTGNSQDFGDTVGYHSGQWYNGLIYGGTGASNGTRGVYAGGYTYPFARDYIQYITIASTGNASDFGDLAGTRAYLAGGGNTTRGIYGGGNALNGVDEYSGYRSTIEYVTIATTGNASAFGSLTVYRSDLGAVNSLSRMVFIGGVASSNPYYNNTMDYITIDTTSNATDFGDTLNYHKCSDGCSNNTRGVYQVNFGRTSSYFYGGSTIGTETLNYITIATTGNASDFGDRTIGSNDGSYAGSCSGD